MKIEKKTYIVESYHGSDNKMADVSFVGLDRWKPNQQKKKKDNFF